MLIVPCPALPTQTLHTARPGALLHDMSSHVFEIEVAPLMAKRQQGGGQQGGGQQGGGAGGTEGGGGDGSGEGRLRIGVMICYGEHA